MPEAMKAKQLNTELLLGALASSRFYTFLSDYLSSLPRYVDDAERDFGSDIYTRMLRDPTLASAINALKEQVMSEAPRFLNPIPAPSKIKSDPTQQAEYDKGEELRLLVEDMCDDLQSPLEEILYEMLDGLCYGHSVAEEVYKPKNGKLMLSVLRVKPRENYLFVVNKYMDTIGLLPKTTNYSVAASSTVVSEADIIPRDKFFILSYLPKGGDPRGTSILRPAYNAWYLKQQTWPQYLKFLAQFGTPSIAAFLPPEAGDVKVVDEAGNITLDPYGNPVVLTAAEAMLQKILAFANGTAVVLENESKIDLLQSQGDGSAYVKAIDLYNREMTRAVLSTTRFTLEAEHGSRADSDTGQDVVGSVAQRIRRLLEAAFYRDVLQPFVTVNFGEDTARRFCPMLSLSDIAREDVAAIGTMVADLANAGLIHSSQYQGIDAKLGLPERDFEAQQEELSKQADRMSMLDIGFPTPRLGSDEDESDKSEE